MVVKRTFYMGPICLKSKKSKKSEVTVKSRGFEDASLDYEGENFADILRQPQERKDIHIDSLVESIRERREQASRTILIAPDVTSSSNPCKRYMRHRVETLVGRVRHVCMTNDTQHCSTSRDFARKSLLVEFQNQEQLDNFSSNHARQFSTDSVTFNQRLLYFSKPWSQSQSEGELETLNWKLNACANVTEQIKVLMQETQLDDAGLRARFFLCNRIELLLEGIFPGCHIYPFGSTISNLGRVDSDLDICLHLPYGSKHTNNDATFFFFTVRDVPDERVVMTRQLRLTASILKDALPGITNLNKILHARIPILKFGQTHTNLKCDLSVQGMDCIIAAQLFSAYSKIDPRVRPYLFALRRWSISNGLSSFVTNFPLSCLGIFYLICKKVVPPMHQVILTKSSGIPESIKSHVQWSTSNTESLEDLLKGFFHFYTSEFDFETQGISVLIGRTYEKTISDPIEIENPLDRDQNCAKLVLKNAFPVFLNCLHQAKDTLNNSMKSEDGDWGLTKLIEVETNLKEIEPLDNFVFQADVIRPEISEEGNNILTEVFMEEAVKTDMKLR